MKQFKAMVTALLAVCFGGTALAGEADPVQMANEAGFVGCDSLITKMFSMVIPSPERQISVSHFKGMAENSLDVYGTFGKIGDTSWHSVHFEKHGGYCYAVGRTLVSREGNCAGLLSKDPDFKYTSDAAGAIWSENKAGIKSIFIQSGTTCNRLFMTTASLEATK